MVLVSIPGLGIVNLDVVRKISTYVAPEGNANGVIFDWSHGSVDVVAFNEVTFPYRTWSEFHENFLNKKLLPPVEQPAVQAEATKDI